MKWASLIGICFPIGGIVFWAGTVQGRIDSLVQASTSQATTQAPAVLQWGGPNGCGYDFVQVPIGGTWDPSNGSEPIVCRWAGAQ